MLVRLTKGPLMGRELDLPAHQAAQLLNDGTAELAEPVATLESAAVNPARERAVRPKAQIQTS
jgi:hypothetical protein